MRKKKPILVAVLGTVVLTALISACSSTADPAGTAAPTVEVTATAAPSPSAESSWPTADTISCDTMLDPAVDASLRADDLVPYEKEFTAFNFVPRGLAIECPWGPPDSAGGAAYAYYTWAELLPGDREALLELAQEGPYTVEETDEGTRLVFEDDGSGNQSEFLVTDRWYASASDTSDGRSIADILWTR